MKDFVDIMGQSMKEKGLSVRALEERIKEIFKEETGVSKTMINYYQKRRFLPPYPAAYQICVALDMDVRKSLKLLKEYREKVLLEEEEGEYRVFLRTLGAKR